MISLTFWHSGSVDSELLNRIEIKCLKFVICHLIFSFCDTIDTITICSFVEIFMSACWQISKFAVCPVKFFIIIFTYWFYFLLDLIDFGRFELNENLGQYLWVVIFCDAVWRFCNFSLLKTMVFQIQAPFRFYSHAYMIIDPLTIIWDVTSNDRYILQPSVKFILPLPPICNSPKN